MIPFNQVKLVFLFIINKNVNFECISIAKHIIDLVHDKLKVKYIRKLVKKSYTPVVPIANTCSIGYPHDSRADNAAYRHDRRADNAAYRHDRRADSLSPQTYIQNICLKGTVHRITANHHRPPQTTPNHRKPLFFCI